MNAIDRGIGQLADADMSEVSTRVQALSIVSSNAQTILPLFQN